VCEREWCAVAEREGSAMCVREGCGVSVRETLECRRRLEAREGTRASRVVCV
jgi:hypothetical protein